MKKWLVYVLGIITGIILTFVFAICVNKFGNSDLAGLEVFVEPGGCMEYSQFEVFQVLDAECALAHVGHNPFGAIVFIIPNENQHFYDHQKIILDDEQCAQRVGTYRYTNNAGMESTVPAIRIVGGR